MYSYIHICVFISFQHLFLQAERIKVIIVLGESPVIENFELVVK